MTLRYLIGEREQEKIERNIVQSLDDKAPNPGFVNNGKTEGIYVFICIRKNMSKNIAVSDEVYEMLKKEKKDRSFSEVIKEKLDSAGKISEVTGGKILDRETMREVKKDVKKGSRESLERMEDEAA